MKGFSIIIVTWNALHHLKTFLPSVVATDYPDYEIILADNGSEDGTAAWVREHYPNVRIASLDQNYGYCGGNNRGATYAEKEILIFLNNDVEVRPDWLYGLNKEFSADEDRAVAQPKILSYERKQEFEYAGAAGGYIDRFGYPYCKGRLLDTLEEDHGQYDQVSEIFWASGAALAIKRDLFTCLGGFDEDFEFHMEEIDLCWRVHRAGKKVITAPESVVYHLGGGSLAMGSPRKVYYNFRNNLYMLWKNLPFPELIFRFPVRLKLDVIAAWRALLAGRGSEFAAIARAHLHFLKAWPALQRKRRAIPDPKIKHLPGRTSISLVWQYFVKRRKTFNQLPGHDL